MLITIKPFIYFLFCVLSGIFSTITWAQPEYPPKTLPERLLQPEAAQWGTFQMRDSMSIRYVSMSPDNEVKGTVIFVHGLTVAPEFSFELFRDFLAMGLAVWALDMPGHGKSHRWLENTHKAYVDDFSTYTEAVNTFRTQVVRYAEDKPIILVGSSMGGHIVTRYAGEYPGQFNAIVAEVPMYGIAPGDTPLWLTRSFAWLGDNFGWSEEYVPGDKDWSLRTDYDLEKSCCSSDPERDLISPYWRIKEPELIIGGVTFGWLNHAFQSMELVNNADFLKHISEPVLILSAGKDPLVDSAMHPVICEQIADCQLAFFPDSKHVPLSERDEIRDKALATIKQFLGAKTDLE